MKSLDFNRYALCISAAIALLTGCGGSQPQIGAPGTMPVANNGSLPYHKTFRYTGSEQSFKVPADVTKLTVIALGARGGGTLGANGGRVFAIIPVTPREKLAVFVGGDASGQNGGFNGGANGGPQDYGPGYGGGGASDIRSGGDRLADRIFVVGGGGGQGGLGYNYAGGGGGKGGGSTGGSGLGGSPSQWSGAGGGGGTQNSGGSGGSAGGGGYINPGSDGSLGAGGAGGSGCSASSCEFGAGGGGGGGGYYGGGGGGTGDAQGFYYYAGGGGGGGSSYIELSATKFRTWKGWKTATSNGLIVFSWR